MNYEQELERTIHFPKILEHQRGKKKWKQIALRYILNYRLSLMTIIQLNEKIARIERQNKCLKIQLLSLTKVMKK